MAEKTLQQFIEELHFSCIAITVAADQSDTIAGKAVNYLHEVLAQSTLTDEQRSVVDRMAAKIAAEGFDLTYGAYDNV